MFNEKKVIIVLVEGISDKNTFQAFFDNYFNLQNIAISVTNGDITQNLSGESTEVKICKLVNKVCEDESFRYDDILKIIHIVDTDGTFIKDDLVIQNTASKTEYDLKNIKAKDKTGLLLLHKKKSETLIRLSESKSVNISKDSEKQKFIDYSIYYLSRNLEHVLYNDYSDISSKRKVELSDSFDEEYAGDIDKLIEFLKEENALAPGDYNESWKFIKKDINSLNRYTNIHLIFR